MNQQILTSSCRSVFAWVFSGVYKYDLRLCRAPRFMAAISCDAPLLRPFSVLVEIRHPAYDAFDAAMIVNSN